MSARLEPRRQRIGVATMNNRRQSAITAHRLGRAPAPRCSRQRTVGAVFFENANERGPPLRAAASLNACFHQKKKKEKKKKKKTLSIGIVVQEMRPSGSGGTTKF